MMMPDVNMLVYAHREETLHHARYAAWLTELRREPFALSELVMHGFVRIVTNRRVFGPPSTTAQAFGFLDELLNRPGSCVIRPGPPHWSIFRELCRSHDLRANLVADAVHAALAIESG